MPAGKIDQLVGTAYVLSNEPVGSELRDASEFSTLLNATARYERADVGLGVCLGDRDDALERARTLLRDHRRNLSSGIDLVTREGVTHEDNIQRFHAGDRIRETIAGIVAGWRWATTASVDRNRSSHSPRRPTAATPTGRNQGLRARYAQPASPRSRPLGRRGEASRAVDGDGGGHDVAAGQRFPRTGGKFVELADEIVGEQLS